MDSVQTKRKSDTNHAAEDHKRLKVDQNDTASTEIDESDEKQERAVVWRELRAENLNCDYCRLYSKSEADDLLRECEKNLTYNTGELTKVFIFGKWQDIPRQQVFYKNII